MYDWRIHGRRRIHFQKKKMNEKYRWRGELRQKCLFGFTPNLILKFSILWSGGVFC